MSRVKYQIFFGVDNSSLVERFVPAQQAFDLLSNKIIYARLGAEVLNEHQKIRTITEKEYTTFRKMVEIYDEL